MFALEDEDKKVCQRTFFAKWKLQDAWGKSVRALEL